MKKLVLATAVAAAFAGSIAHAEDPKPDHELSFNAAVVSDYRYRGISQTRREPALQGGADYTHNPSGFYVGTWLSTIKWAKDLGGDGNIEWDIYAGKRGEIMPSVSYDVGVLTYIYPSNKLDRVPGYTNADTTELYGQLGYGPAYVKYSHAVTTIFGNPGSKNSGYLDIGANVEVGEGLTLNLHAGHQKVKGLYSNVASYTDYKVGLTKDFGFVTGSVAYIMTNANSSFYYGPAPELKYLGKDNLVFSISKTF
ncbi:conserved hypothetical protein [Noviherbaspirillum humi]|uniref:Uncharacterized protein n=1 Tax=Noviherbaspirillum humi TaxID=1688639 RepID=A0A239CB83_9BURK|nr:TorF family putative porin [Noviherbaspirillum humi]SNS16891.1 conserved hypothetical protein [Noviherbaspirillum humi]